jgi:hypothetical protein
MPTFECVRSAKLRRLALPMQALALLALVVAGAPGCAEESDSPSSQESDVIVDTKSELAWRQYLANVRFAEGYAPRCAPREEGLADSASRPRILVTGFGRVLSNRENATGRIVSSLVPALTYPLTDAPAAGEIDDPAAQTAVELSIIELPGVGEVEVCAMVLPVFWDLASYLVLAEANAFAPDVVLMNGIAGGQQPIWMELGSTNAAVALPDGSGILLPIETGTPLVADLPEEDHARGLLMSWDEVRAAVEARIGELAEEAGEDGETFGGLLQGVRFAGYPRESNTYLCNNTTFVVNWAMDHPGETFRLLEPSDPRDGGPTGLDVSLYADLRHVPRDFVHWPSRLAGSHVDRAASALGTLLAAQLLAEEAPSRGDASRADL